MLGLYENFPTNVHKILRFATRASNRRLQQAIIQTTATLNKENLILEEIAKPSIPDCTVIFEFGIAEGNFFNYLDPEEKQKIMKKIRKIPLKIMDLFCAVRYYKKKGKGRTPLKFDYYMLRLTFNSGLIEFQVFHERGPRHLLPEDIVNFIVSRINNSFKRKMLKAI